MKVSEQVSRALAEQAAEISRLRVELQQVRVDFNATKSELKIIRKERNDVYCQLQQARLDTERLWRAIDALLSMVRLPATSICVDPDPAGSTYEVRPSRSTLELFRILVPDVTEDDFEVMVGAGTSRDYCYMKPRLRTAIDAARAKEPKHAS